MSDQDSPIKKRARALAEDARELAEEVAEAARTGADKAVHYVEDEFEDAQRFIKRQWRDHPVATAAAAVGVGMILGMLLTGRRR